MHITNLRKIGDSVMLTIPPAFLDQLKLVAGASVEVTIDHGHLIIKPHAPRYTLEELIAATDPAALAADKEDIWMTGGPVGKELL
ncbi:antitoxin [Acidovorax sp. JMULE5]|uniref:AbrB/MazE/SpoVT family DNA-binding domain-containing protein n=1 Tax=Acidovorax sp. JMULE5 TaxID=2518343 RepID=UPI0015A3F7F1|nr:AbrB/MazE/SpoVT family DNA-binding domain-containing protein [Acidovorax sp. JMULE5]QLA80405.1 antitoxin [Acidovorax sp. JMULE5]